MLACLRCQSQKSLVCCGDAATASITRLDSAKSPSLVVASAANNLPYARQNAVDTTQTVFADHCIAHCMFKRFSVSPRILPIPFAVLGWIGIVGILVGVVVTIVNSRDVCTRHVASKGDAVAAMREFFNSRSGAAEAMITELRHDGMTDESLETLKHGCSSCYVKLSNEDDALHHGLEANRWYAWTGIAEKKGVVLQVNCAQDIRLWDRYYGG